MVQLTDSPIWEGSADAVKGPGRQLCGKVVFVTSLGLAPRVQGRAQNFSEGAGGGGGLRRCPKATPELEGQVP